MCTLSVFDAAQYFLSKESMTHKKLQKLCYYAQAWHCALEGSPLFVERIEAWVHGPTIPELYRKYKDCGWQEISLEKREDENVIPEKTLEILEAVYDTYGEFSGLQLETLAQSETPFKEARGNIEWYEVCTNEITLDSMKKYYLKKYQEDQDD